jgi:site-specific DNA-methyltransferase (adenine-specific)
MDLSKYEYFRTDLGMLYCGDCLEILPHLEPNVVVGETKIICITDPPYGMKWNTNYSRFLRGTRDKTRIENDDAPFDPTPFLRFDEIIIWGFNHFAGSLPVGSILVWDKRNADGTAFLSHGEIAWWNKGTGVYIKSISGQRHRSTCGGFHPTQKPVGLMEWCIEMSKSNGTILDPFLGSGTTAVASEQLNRRWIGIESSEKYCQIAKQRIERERQQLKMFEPEQVKHEQGSLF